MAAPKHSFKRRRLSSSLSQRQSSPDLTTATSPKILTASNAKNNPTCVSCHRSLNATQGYLILCGRCSTPTCIVCSRTCNASVPSTPPTPHLTWSSSPSPTVPSPRRMALTLNSANINLGINLATAGSGGGPIDKRRKFTDDDDSVGGRKFQEKSDVGDRDQDTLPGCGRVICRNCCFENSQHTITCYDCYGP